VIEIPSDNEVHARAAMYRGYNCKDDGSRLWTVEDLQNYMAE